LTVFVDSNIPMYLVGASHPNKQLARQLLRAAIARGERLVTSAEVLQEILHRYVAIRRHEAIQPAFDALLEVVDEVLAVTRADAERARDLVLTQPRLSARDALHAALMERSGIRRLISFDSGFDQVAGLTRLGG